MNALTDLTAKIGGTADLTLFTALTIHFFLQLGTGELPKQVFLFLSVSVLILFLSQYPR